MSEDRCEHGVPISDGPCDLCRLAEIHRLRCEIRGDGHCQRAELLADRQRLREAIRIYGGHVPPCQGRPCDCGFKVVWDRFFVPLGEG